MMFQEILDGITRHRANPIQINRPSSTIVANDLVRKINEIEWALQAMCEKLRDQEVHDAK